MKKIVLFDIIKSTFRSFTNNLLTDMSPIGNIGGSVINPF